MRYYPWIEDETPFPPVDSADQYGILAVGGELSVERLLDAYSRAIFPWYEEDQPVIWWSPDPRFVLFPEKVLVSKSMRQVLRRNLFEVRFDTAFRRVITSCAETPRRHERGTWITPDMIEAYCELHAQGYAHSAEAWQDGELVGGLYGVSLGSIFFGESMFARVSNASKAAFLTLTGKLSARNFTLIDSQVRTDHLTTLGGEEITRSRYLDILADALTRPTLRGNWGELLADR
ncbi:MAG TPA: leucyl/phenylalanyl-tRNA--protein transferase [Spirochaetota bacterium]